MVHGGTWYVMVEIRPGTLRQLQVGPTALISLLTGQALDAVNLSPGVC